MELSKFKENPHMTIFYIHGYGSDLNSPTLRQLKELLPVIGLTYDYNDPESGIKDMIRQIAESKGYPTVIGSSLGGWYAEQLTKFVAGEYIMYNPATMPQVSLAKYGVKQEALYKYSCISTKSMRPNSRTVVLSMDDDVIDPSFALNKYKNNSQIIETSGGHRMTAKNMDLIVERVKYLQNQIN